MNFRLSDSEKKRFLDWKRFIVEDTKECLMLERKNHTTRNADSDSESDREGVESMSRYDFTFIPTKTSVKITITDSITGRKLFL